MMAARIRNNNHTSNSINSNKARHHRQGPMCLGNMATSSTTQLRK
jgi:hypothetical protein